mmetsp:Transcript_95289/g.168372  ORF Transcript_95289/g.168372 Transcript_95289/m.168372 type:complete len:217 (+) Transcript_95289:361-1011(+)
MNPIPSMKQLDEGTSCTAPATLDSIVSTMAGPLRDSFGAVMPKSAARGNDALFLPDRAHLCPAFAMKPRSPETASDVLAQLSLDLPPALLPDGVVVAAESGAVEVCNGTSAASLRFKRPTTGYSVLSTTRHFSSASRSSGATGCQSTSSRSVASQDIVAKHRVTSLPARAAYPPPGPKKPALADTSRISPATPKKMGLPPSPECCRNSGKSRSRPR